MLVIPRGQIRLRLGDFPRTNTLSFWRFPEDAYTFMLKIFRGRPQPTKHHGTHDQKTHYHEHTLRYSTKKYCRILAVVPVFVLTLIASSFFFVIFVWGVVG